MNSSFVYHWVKVPRLFWDLYDARYETPPSKLSFIKSSTNYEAARITAKFMEAGGKSIYVGKGTYTYSGNPYDRAVNVGSHPHMLRKYLAKFKKTGYNGLVSILVADHVSNDAAKALEKQVAAIYVPSCNDNSILEYHMGKDVRVRKRYNRLETLNKIRSNRNA